MRPGMAGKRAPCVASRGRTAQGYAHDEADLVEQLAAAVDVVVAQDIFAAQEVRVGRITFLGLRSNLDPRKPFDF